MEDKNIVLKVFTVKKIDCRATERSSSFIKFRLTRSCFKRELIIYESCGSRNFSPITDDLTRDKIESV